MKKKLLTLLLLTLLSGHSTLATADKPRLLDLSLEDLMNVEIATATKTEEKRSVVPAVVTVISAADLAAYGYTSVAEALSHVAGFVAGDDLVRHNFGVRGIHAGQRAGSRIIKFMLDGQPIAFRTTQQQFIGPELLPMDLIERIEIVRGPASALYGANAFAGVVNVITRGGDYFAEQGRHLRLAAGRAEAAGRSVQAAFSDGLADGPWDFAAGFNYTYQDRGGLELPRRSPLYHLFADGVGGRVTQTSHNSAWPFGVYARAGWRDGDTRSLRLSAHYQVLDAEQPFADLSPLRAPGVSREALHNGFVRLEWEQRFYNVFQARVFAAHAEGAPEAEDRVEIGAGNYYLRRELGYRAQDVGAELIWTPNERTSILAGLDYNHEDTDLAHFARVPRAGGTPTALNQPRRETFIDRGVYLQWQYRFVRPWLASRWRTLAGFRYDEHSYTGGQDSLRAALVAELPHSRILKLLFGSAFQSPSPELLFRQGVQSGDIVGNPELTAQRAETAELSLATPLGDDLHLTATLFYTRISDLVLYESTLSNFIARNSTDSNTQGMELELRYGNENLTGYANAAWQNTTVEDNPYNLFVLNEREHGSLFPRFSANFGFSYRWPALRLSLDNRYVGARPASTQNVLTAQRFYDLDAYLETSLGLSTSRLFPAKNATLRFQIVDLWDSSAVQPGYGGIEVPSLGRRYRVSFEQRFQ